MTTHHDIVGAFRSNSFTSARRFRLPKPAPARSGAVHLDRSALSRAIRDGVAGGFARAGAAAATARIKASGEAAAASLSGLADSTARLATAVETYKARRQAMVDVAAAPSGLVSATSGYIRDAAGNRVRPMTPADLNAIADKHYGRTR